MMNEYDELSDFIEPVTASECFNKAVEFLERGEFDSALKYVDAAIEQGYFGVDIYLIRAQILLELNRPEDANIDIETALEQEPNNSEFIIWKSRTLMLMNKVDEAIKLLDELINDDPLNSEAQLTKALIFYSESRLDEAEEAFLRIYDNGSGLPEQSAVSAYWLAKIKQLDSKNDEAFEYFEISINLAPFYSYVYSDYAELLRQEKKLTQSEEIFQQALDLFPENAALANDYANLLREMNKNEDSIHYLKHAIKNDSSLIPAYYNLGLSYQKINKHKQAYECFEKVVNDNPDDTEAKIRLADSLLHLKKYKQAYELAYNVVENEPENVEFLLVFIGVSNAYLADIENTQDWMKIIEVYIAMFNTSIDAFKPRHSTSQNSIALDRLLKVFRQLEVYNVEKHPKSQILQLYINIIRFHHALIIYEYIVDKSDLINNQYEMNDEILTYINANIGIIRKISSRFDSESDSLAYFGYYLQALYHWRINDSYIDAESNFVKALSLCENNLAALFNVKAQFYKSKFSFREAIHEYFMIIKHDSTAVWIYLKISKLYAGLRNFEAAKYYHAKYIQSIKEFSISKREKARNFLDSAALWVAIGNYEMAITELEKCNQYKDFLGNRSLKRLKLLDAFVSLEVNNQNVNVEELLFSTDIKDVDFTNTNCLNSFFASIHNRYFRNKRKPIAKKIYAKLDDEVDTGSSAHEQLSVLDYLSLIETYYQNKNKRKLNSVFNKLLSVLKTFDVYALSDYYREMSLANSDSTQTELSLKLLAPLMKVDIETWDFVSDFIDYPEGIAYFRRIVMLKVLAKIRNSINDKNIKHAINELLFLNKIFPSYKFARTLLMFETLLHGESDDYLNLDMLYSQQEKLLQIRNLIFEGQLEYAEDLVFINDIESQQSNYELARISALMGNNDDAISYLEDFLSNSTNKDIAEYLIKSDFAFDVLKIENSRFIRLFLTEDEEVDDVEDDFDDSDIDSLAFLSDIDPEPFEQIDQDVIDVIADINKNIESIASSIKTENSNENTTLTDEDASRDIDVNSLPIKEKKQTKKLDSSKDKSSDSDDKTY